MYESDQFFQSEMLTIDVIQFAKSDFLLFFFFFFAFFILVFSPQ